MFAPVNISMTSVPLSRGTKRKADSDDDIEPPDERQQKRQKIVGNGPRKRHETNSNCHILVGEVGQHDPFLDITFGGVTIHAFFGKTLGLLFMGTQMNDIFFDTVKTSATGIARTLKNNNLPDPQRIKSKVPCKITQGKRKGQFKGQLSHLVTWRGVVKLFLTLRHAADLQAFRQTVRAALLTANRVENLPALTEDEIKAGVQDTKDMAVSAFSLEQDESKISRPEYKSVSLAAPMSVARGQLHIPAKPAPVQAKPVQLVSMPLSMAMPTHVSVMNTPMQQVFMSLTQQGYAFAQPQMPQVMQPRYLHTAQQLQHLQSLQYQQQVQYVQQQPQQLSMQVQYAQQAPTALPISSNNSNNNNSSSSCNNHNSNDSNFASVAVDLPEDPSLFGQAGYISNMLGAGSSSDESSSDSEPDLPYKDAASPVHLSSSADEVASMPDSGYSSFIPHDDAVLPMDTYGADATFASKGEQINFSAAPLSLLAPVNMDQFISNLFD